MRNDLDMGGVYPVLHTFTGSEQTLPARIKCIKPNDPCTISSLKDNMDTTNHASTFATVNIGAVENYTPLKCDTRKAGKQVYWSKVTGTNGNTCWLYQ